MTTATEEEVSAELASATERLESVVKRLVEMAEKTARGQAVVESRGAILPPTLRGAASILSLAPAVSDIVGDTTTAERLREDSQRLRKDFERATRQVEQSA